jgi:hypothetical protein
VRSPSTIVTKLKNMSEVGDVVANKKPLFEVPHFGPVKRQRSMELNKAFSACWHVLRAFVAVSSSVTVAA